MAGLTTHVLDVANGCPAPGLSIALYTLSADHGEAWIRTASTNADGRTDEPMLLPSETKPGIYELRFDVGAYFAGKGQADSEHPFLGVVPVRFAISDTARHYHVPLLVAPWSYTTYRGS